jgi:hypothetical protein
MHLSNPRHFHYRLRQNAQNGLQQLRLPHWLP